MNTQKYIQDNYGCFDTSRLASGSFIDSLRYCQKNKGLNLFAYVIMSNHVHLIIQSEDGKLSDLIRDIRKFTAQQILLELKKECEEIRSDWMLKRFEFQAKKNAKGNSFTFWKPGFHPKEIYSEEFMLTKLNYVHMNPVRAGIVKKASDYIYCSASNYVGKEENLMDVISFSGRNLRRNKRFQKDVTVW